MSWNKINKFIKMNCYEKRRSLVRNSYYWIKKRKFKHIGRKSYFMKPIYLSGTKYIEIGDDVEVWSHARVELIDCWCEQKFKPRLKIGNHVNIGQDLHLTCAGLIEIEDNVLCTSRVTITDIIHCTNDNDLPVLEQNIVTKPVKICEGAFIGINSVIMPGVTIGRHAVVGANSVVTKDVPEFATVVGAPAKVIRVNKNG